MTVSRTAYLEWLQTIAHHRPQAWQLRSQRTGTEASRSAKLAATLRFFEQEHRLPALEAQLRAEPPASDLSPAWQGLIAQTFEDLRSYVDPAAWTEFDRITVGLLPLRAIDACCIDRTLHHQALDGYLILVNEGLFVCAQLLSKAFLLDNLEGELAPFHRPGAPIQRQAAEQFLSLSAAQANAVFFDGVPPEIEGLLAAAQMRMTILLMQFVLLHEVGHILHRDFALMGAYRFHIAQDPNITPTPTTTDRWWAAEEAADTFALAAICRQATSDLGRWANAIAVCVLFDWFRTVEDILGRPLCPLHPPPARRGERLLQWMRDQYPPDEIIEVHLRKSLQILETWKQASAQR